MKRIFVFVVFLLVFCSFSHAQGYSIKNRWNTKLSVSFNRTNEGGSHYFAEIDGITLHPIQARLNARAECNYGVLNRLELGGYLGYIRYYNFHYGLKIGEKNENPKIAFAPTFGVNVNLHLLPFWIKNKNNRWELYLTAKYGGTYLINHTGFRSKGFSITSNNGIPQEYEIICGPERYRHIYGVGVGGGVYFKNIFGIYTEVMVGQYSYFPEIVRSPYTIRVGIEFKFYSKKYKEKMQALELKPSYND